MKVDVIIPVYKPGQSFFAVIDKLEHQSVPVNQIILANTEEKHFVSLMNERNLLEEYDNIRVIHLKKDEFDHGKTRDMAVQESQGEIFVMMTQDATPKDETLIENLLQGLDTDTICACYARQLPYEGCRTIESFQRQFNYGKESCEKYMKDVDRLGIKTFFCSNVCCAYKRDVYDKVGGFVKRAIFNEDMIYACTAMKAGYGIAYNANAQVYHSHNYSFKQQFQRNFDLGVSQAMHPEVFQMVPSESEGIRSVKQGFSYLWKEKKYAEMLRLFFHSGCKYLGYRLGKKYEKLPISWVRAFSMNKEFWKK